MEFEHIVMKMKMKMRMRMMTGNTRSLATTTIRGDTDLVTTPSSIVTLRGGDAFVSLSNGSRILIWIV